jgi:hypothetical protein
LVDALVWLSLPLSVVAFSAVASLMSFVVLVPIRRGVFIG